MPAVRGRAGGRERERGSAPPPLNGAPSREQRPAALPVRRGQPGAEPPVSPGHRAGPAAAAAPANHRRCGEGGAGCGAAAAAPAG